VPPRSAGRSLQLLESVRGGEDRFFGGEKLRRGGDRTRRGGDRTSRGGDREKLAGRNLKRAGDPRTFAAGFPRRAGDPKRRAGDLVARAHFSARRAKTPAISAHARRPGWSCPASVLIRTGSRRHSEAHVELGSDARHELHLMLSNPKPNASLSSVIAMYSPYTCEGNTEGGSPRRACTRHAVLAYDRPPSRGQSDYAASLLVSLFNSNSIGLT
jgi:hypothetical protein